MSIEHEIDFLHQLANEVERHGNEFGKGRAVGIREAIKPLHAEIVRLNAQIVEIIEKHQWQNGKCVECDALWEKHPNHYNGCLLKAALDAAKETQ